MSLLSRTGVKLVIEGKALEVFLEKVNQGLEQADIRVRMQLRTEYRANVMEPDISLMVDWFTEKEHYYIALGVAPKDK